jgi:hypothetical protein
LAGDLTEFRRQQAEFARTRREIADRYSWTWGPVLAAPALALGLGAVGWNAARLAASQPKPDPLLLERLKYLRVGDNYATRAGRRAHQALKDRVEAKPGWAAEQVVPTRGGFVRPDVRAPVRPSRPDKPFQMELKPNTPTGRRAAKKAVERYIRETGRKTRAIYYNPKDYM